MVEIELEADTKDDGWNLWSLLAETLAVPSSCLTACLQMTSHQPRPPHTILLEKQPH